MSRFEKPENNSSHAENIKAAALSPADWASENFVNPLMNNLCVEPANAAAWAANSMSNQNIVHRLEPCPVPDAKPYSPEIVCQTIGGAIGMVVPYALAGRCAGNVMRFAGGTLKTEGMIAAFAESENAAQIIGAGCYDAMKETQTGETHLRNGAAGALNFGILEYFGRANGNFMHRAGGRLLTGIAGSLTHTAVARPDLFNLNHKGDLQNVSNQALTNGLMNVLLPGTQEQIRIIQDRASLGLGMGVPINRYVKYNENVFSKGFVAMEDQSLLAVNRWAQVQPNAKFSCYQSGKDLVVIKDGSTIQTVRHELQHRKEALSGVAEPGFTRAAELLNQDVEQSWQVFRSVRLAQEIRAELTQHRALGTARYFDQISELKESIPGSMAVGGVPYSAVWRDEFVKFRRSGGKFRPEQDYSGGEKYTGFEYEGNKLFARLRLSQPNVNDVLCGILKRQDISTDQVTKVFRHVNEILDPQVEEAVSWPVDKLAMQTLRLAAKPEKVVQGNHPTCGPASLEYYTYVKHPENAANLISQVVRTNKYECRDGSSIVVNGLNVVPERYWQRSHANQLFQNTAVNVHWQRKSDLTPWLTKEDSPDISIKPGLTRYQRDLTNRLNESPYRLLDYSKDPTALVHDRLPLYNEDPSDPLMNCDAMNDINYQINGTAHGDVTLPEEYSSLQQINSLLHARHAVGRLPVITVVDSQHPLFSDALSDPEHGGWHLVVVKSFDPHRKVVSLFNPWGYLQEDISTKQLFEANRKFKIAADERKL